jgi:hypothetical protein
MAQVDIKHATIRVKDGTSILGAINDATPPIAGDGTITVDGFSVAIPVGSSMKVAGETDTNAIHTVVSTVGGSTPTSITFTPVLGAGTYLDNGIVTIGPNILNIKIGDGNLKYTEKKDMEYIRDRRNLDIVREKDEQPVEVDLEFVWEFLRADSGDPPTFEDALKKRGNASTWKSTDPDQCQPYCVDLEIIYTPPCTGIKREIIELPLFRFEDLDHDLTNGKVSVKGKCNVTEAIVTRVT